MSISKTSLFDKAVESVEKCVSGTVNHFSNSNKFDTKEERESFVSLALVSNRTAIIFGNELLLNEFKSMGLPAKLYTVDSFLDDGLRECMSSGFANVYIHSSVDGEFIKAMKSEFKNNNSNDCEDEIGYIGRIRGKSGHDMLNSLWDDMSFRYNTK